MKNPNYREYPETCRRCERYDNNCPDDPSSYLDKKTRLCEECYEELNEEKLEEADV